MTTDLCVMGFVEIPFETTGKGNKHKQITKINRKEFFEKEDFQSISNKQGCYVFALKAAQGFTPWYVGKTKISMINECMTDGKLIPYNEVLFRGLNGKPVMFFVVPPGDKKKIPQKIIDEIETFLIRNARLKNDKLKNKQKIKPLQWSIKGVFNSARGGPETEAKSFKKMIGL